MMNVVHPRSSDSLSAGDSVSHYRILGSLGRGGMGEVYLAEDEKLQRRVALKMLLAETSRDRDHVRRFVRESRITAALTHPNIVTIFEIGEHEGVPFLAMEYVE